MRIETLDDWTTVLAACGCCDVFPDTASPVRDTEALEADVVILAAVYVIPENTHYRTSTDSWSDGGSIVVNAPRGWQAYISRVGLGGGAFEVDPTALEYTFTDPRTGTLTTTYTNPITDIDALRSSAISAINASGGYWSLFTPKTSPIQVTRTHTPVTGSAPDYILTVDLLRFKWNITAHTGAWYKITWDYAFYPSAGGPAIPISRDETWEWTGPAGGPPLGSEDSWKSDYFYFPIPDDAGVIKIVNIRYSGWRSTKIGIPIEVTGDAEDYT